MVREAGGPMARVRERGRATAVRQRIGLPAEARHVAAWEEAAAVAAAAAAARAVAAVMEAAEGMGRLCGCW